MIRHLYIKDFVLINEISLDFEEGFSAFTGETGAGKSILIDAISILAGSRAGASFVAKGKKRALIEGAFDLSNDFHALSVLQEAGFETGEETVFTREISAAGKSTARIDHRIVPLSMLEDCLKNEIDIHGQRDNAYLLNTNTHIHLLDQFVNNKELLEKTQSAFRRYDSLVRERDEALESDYNENDLEYFRYELSEIEDAHLREGEEDELQEKEKQYKAVKSSFEKLDAIFSIYTPMSDQFYELNHLVQSLKADAHVEEVQNAVNDAFYTLSDAMETLQSMMDSMNISEEEINEMEERLFTIQKLKRKYGRTVSDIFEKAEELRKRIDAAANRQEYLAKMERRISAARKEYDALAAELSASRQAHAGELDEAIASNLIRLSLPNARFHTEIRSGKPSASGSDTVEFLISMNKGEDLKSLSKTASGGELSRLMLGLKVIFTKLQGLETVIFDEIDTGVSGPVATAIGRCMKDLGNDCQVFSVTHLAQVAACADRQYLVSKSTDQDSTHTDVHMLTEEERIDQIALIANGEITELSRKAARELYKRNRS